VHPRRILPALISVVGAGAILPVIVIGACLPEVARAQPGPVQEAPSEQPELALPPMTVVETRSATWPVALGMHALIGVEPHDRGNPVAFGAGAELLWRGRLGGFAMLLASSGTAVIPPTVNNKMLQSFADRISVPFGFAIRPLATIGMRRHDYWGRLLTGIGAQVGLTVEHLRTSDDSDTTAGLHLGLGVDVPLWGGTREGGVALRVYGRLMVTPSVTLDYDPPSGTFLVYEPPVSGQFFAGVTYYP
jgi:hypothetical protein